MAARDAARRGRIEIFKPPMPDVLIHPVLKDTPNGGAAASRRARLARILDALGLLDRLLWLRSRLGLEALTVLTYHRVGVPGSDDLDPGLVEVEPDELASQLEIIKRHCNVVSPEDLCRVRDGKRLPVNPVILTFDDGYADNHQTALPILERAGVPATFFIPTAFPDAGRLFWWDRVYLSMKRSTRDVALFTYPTLLRVEPKKDPRGAAHAVCDAFKRTPGPDLVRFYEELERSTGVVLSQEEERKLAQQAIMSWSMVRDLRARGMDVQSHSHDHFVLNTMSPERAHKDLAKSRSILHEAMSSPVHSVAYPVGYKLGGALRSASRDARFALGFTNNTGLCFTRHLDPLNVPRVSMDLETRGSLYKALLLMGDDPGGFRNRPPPTPPR